MSAPAAPPPRPSSLEERLSSRLFLALSPHLPRVVRSAPPSVLEPWEPLRIPRRGRGGFLHATLYPAPEVARGVVLFLPPWMEWGQTYFHRRGRLGAVRRAGYHAVTVDLSGFGESSPPRGLFDLDVADALAALEASFPGLPIVVWGVSSGGYWAHPVLARQNGVRAAIFEDVAIHLLEWSWREVPHLRPGYLCVRWLFPRTYRFLDLRRHAPHLRTRRLAYVSGRTDRGVRPQDTEELARLAGAAALVVPLAGHLGAIKRAPDEIFALALRLFGEDAPQAAAK